MSELNIVLSPHFDDAVLSLGGFLARNGTQSVVMTFCGGRPSKPVLKPWDKDSGFIDSDNAMNSRIAENERSLKYLGVPEKQVINYPFLDSQYQSIFQHATNSQFSGMEAAIAKLLERYASTETFFYAPGLEEHRDHKNVKLAFLNSLKTQSNHKHSYYLYQDLPYADDFLNLNKASDRTVTRSGLDALRNKILHGYGAMDEVIELDQDSIEKKVVAVEMYKSQIAPLRTFSGIDMGLVVKNFAANQAKALNISAPYCEVVYKLSEY